MPEDQAEALAEPSNAGHDIWPAATHLVVADFVEMGKPGTDGKSELYLAARDLRVRLHKRQLDLLKLYDGARSSDAVCVAYKAETGKPMTLETLQTFEEKMQLLGFLERGGQSAGQRVDPFAGIEYGLTRRRPPAVIFNLDDTDHSLGPLLRFLSQPAGFASLALLALFIGYGWLLSFQQASMVWNQLPRLLNTVWWVFLFYPVWFTIMTFHEVAHALACMVKGVSMREVGIGRRGILFVGWAKPDQAQWSALGYSDKVFTVIAGPLANLSFFGLGVVLWSMIQNQTAADIVLSAAFLPLFTMIPTLIPTNKGDAYLLISEAIAAPGYYTRATRHIWSLRQRVRDGGRAELTTPLGIFAILVILTRISMLCIFGLILVQASINLLSTLYP